ncbi:CDC42 small effector protein 1-like [Arapaima gigas]
MQVVISFDVAGGEAKGLSRSGTGFPCRHEGIEFGTPTPTGRRQGAGNTPSGQRGMSEFWHKMSCCVVAKPPPKKKRRKIDRSMIGEPMNFQHLTHIGSGEMTEGLPLSHSVKEQMRLKGQSANGCSSFL